MGAQRYWCRRSYQNGARVAEHDPGFANGWSEGTLEVKQRHDPVLARTVMVARLVTPQQGDAQPELIDAELIGCDADALHLTGYERDVLTRRDTMQAWTYHGPAVNHFHCLPLRSEGAPKPRWIQSSATWFSGRLGLANELDRGLGRWAPVARFKALQQDSETVQPLLAAKLIQLVGERMVLTGMNRHPETGVEVAQTWLLMRTDTPQGGGVLW